VRWYDCIWIAVVNYHDEAMTMNSVLNSRDLDDIHVMSLPWLPH
jgi:hypothetical protein